MSEPNKDVLFAGRGDGKQVSRQISDALTEEVQRQMAACLAEMAASKRVVSIDEARLQLIRARSK